jgi:hypothetical protein
MAELAQDRIGTYMRHEREVLAPSTVAFKLFNLQVARRNRTRPSDSSALRRPLAVYCRVFRILLVPYFFVTHASMDKSHLTLIRA